MNIVVAFAALLFLLPVMLLVGLVVYAQDGGPILFAHQRIGLNGRRFHCLKFRSMAVDAEQRLAALLATDPAALAEWQEDHKLRRDPRVTRLGAFLRTTIFMLCYLEIATRRFCGAAKLRDRARPTVVELRLFPTHGMNS